MIRGCLGSHTARKVWWEKGGRSNAAGTAPREGGSEGGGGGGRLGHDGETQSRV